MNAFRDDLRGCPTLFCYHLRIARARSWFSASPNPKILILSLCSQTAPHNYGSRPTNPFCSCFLMHIYICASKDYSTTYVACSRFSCLQTLTPHNPHLAVKRLPVLPAGPRDPLPRRRPRALHRHQLEPLRVRRPRLRAGLLDGEP
jgi:hypothetical protein